MIVVIESQGLQKNLTKVFTKEEAIDLKKKFSVIYIIIIIVTDFNNISK